jgi:hypothetical protein
MSTTEETQLRGVTTVRVRKYELLERIRKNRDEHREIFEEAITGWKQRVTEVLEEAYQDALQGKKFEPSHWIPRPEDHTDEYDTVIELLDMSLDEELELTRQEFANYALDNWNWQHDFLVTASNYGSGKAQFRAPEGSPPTLNPLR